MPKVTNESAHRMTFKAIREDAKRIIINPLETQEFTKEELNLLYSKDVAFKHYHADRALEISDWKPPAKDEIERLSRMPRHYTNTHTKMPNEDSKKRGIDKPDAPRSTTPIEPTPHGGVPGSARQAKAAVTASVNMDQLAVWLEKDSRDSIKTHIKARMGILKDQLRTAGHDEEKGE